MSEAYEWECEYEREREAWAREKLANKQVRSFCWASTVDMVVDPLTKVVDTSYLKTLMETGDLPRGARACYSLSRIGKRRSGNGSPGHPKESVSGAFGWWSLTAKPSQRKPGVGPGLGLGQPGHA